MQSSTNTDRDTLVRTLEEIEAIDKEIAVVDETLKEMKRRRAKLEEIALEEMAAARMERGVPAGGRTWRVQWEHSMSVTKEKSKELLEVLRREGVLDGFLDISTTKVKTWLIEKATLEKKDPKGSYVAGTTVDGLVSDYVRPVLRHVTVAGRASE
jgi:hypothetical protein